MDTTSKKEFTHFDQDGNAVMVDVGGKDVTRREAVAAGKITMNRDAFELVKTGDIRKGDVLGISRVAGIIASKKVDELIPLAHPLMINKVSVEFEFDEENCAILIEAKVGIDGKTGVEMEALTAVSVSALTIYDMCKAVDKSMVISDIRLLRKVGGKSGLYVREKQGAE